MNDNYRMEVTLPVGRMVCLDEGVDPPPAWPWYEVQGPAPEEVVTQIRERLSEILGLVDER